MNKFKKMIPTFLLIIYFLILTTSCHIGYETGHRFSEGGVETDLQLIEDCLKRFIDHNKDDPNIQLYFDLNADSLKGTRMKIVEGSWSVGEWVVEERDLNVAAYYSRSFGNVESYDLSLKLQKRIGGYEVLSWNISISLLKKVP